MILCRLHFQVAHSPRWHLHIVGSLHGHAVYARVDVPLVDPERELSQHFVHRVHGGVAESDESSKCSKHLTSFLDVSSFSSHRLDQLTNKICLLSITNVISSLLFSSRAPLWSDPFSRCLLASPASSASSCVSSGRSPSPPPSLSLDCRCSTQLAAAPATTGAFLPCGWNLGSTSTIMLFLNL